MEKLNKTDFYDFFLNLNQGGAIRCGLLGLIDVSHLQIMSTIQTYVTSPSAKSANLDGHTYYHIHHQMIIDRQPFSRLKSRTPIKNRIKDLCNVGLLIAHRDNQITARSWYRFGPKYDIFINYKNGENVQKKFSTPVPDEGQVPVSDGGQVTHDLSSAKSRPVLSEGRDLSFTEVTAQVNNISKLYKVKEWGDSAIADSTHSPNQKEIVQKINNLIGRKQADFFRRAEISFLTEQQISFLLRWLRYRYEIKKPITISGIEITAAKIRDLPPDHVEKSLIRSIENKYTALFYPEYLEKLARNDNNASTSTPEKQAHNRDVLRKVSERIEQTLGDHA